MLALLSFRGRTSRLAYWRTWLLCNLAGSVFLVMSLFAIQAVGVLGAILFLPALLFSVASLAAWIRRLHDRGKSAWWALVFLLAPVALGGVAQATLKSDTTSSSLASLLFSLPAFGISLWALIEVGFRHGQPAPNRFGNPPEPGR